MVNKAILLTATAALAEQAMAFNSYRHGHQHNVQKRDNVEWVTVYQTVVVHAGQEVPAATEAPVAEVQPEQQPEEQPQEQPDVVEVAPTTLATAVKPAETETTSNDDVEQFGTASGSFGFPKRGMAYNSAELANNFGSACKKCGWAYNWDSLSNGLDSKYSFVPMLWNDQPLHTDRWTRNCDESIKKGSKAILSFNEPDHAGQAAMTPQRAAASHAKWLHPYSGKALIGAPAVTNSGNPGEGLQWLKSFFEACNAQGGCKVDFCPIHWYSEAQWGETLITHIEKAHEICGGRPIWLTEFAPLGSTEDKRNFLTKYLPKLDSISYLEAYSYFMVAADNLLSGNTALSPFGQVYANA